MSLQPLKLFFGFVALIQSPAQAYDGYDLAGGSRFHSDQAPSASKQRYSQYWHHCSKIKLVIGKLSDSLLLVQLLHLRLKSVFPSDA